MVRFTPTTDPSMTKRWESPSSTIPQNTALRLRGMFTRTECSPPIPFGLHDFGNVSADGSHTFKPGETMTLRYLVILHKGDEKEGLVEESFAT